MKYLFCGFDLKENNNHEHNILGFWNSIVIRITKIVVLAMI